MEDFGGRRAYRLVEPNFARVKHDNVLIADALRHQIQLHADAIHGYYIVDDIDDPGNQQLFKFCHGGDPYAALEQARLDYRANLVRSATPVANSGTTTTAATIHNMPQQADHGVRPDTTSQLEGTSKAWPSIPLGSGQTASGCSADVVGVQALPPQVHAISAPQPDPHLRETLDNIIYQAECNALIPLSIVGEKHPPAHVLYAFYAINMRVDERHLEFMPYARKDYRLIVDTGETHTWIYASKFQFLTDVKLARTDTESSEYKLRTPIQWLKEHPEQLEPTVSAHRYRMHLPTPAGVEPIETVLRTYEDSIIVLLSRWGRNYPIHALFPCYDWQANKTCESYLQLPRVLATAVLPEVASRPFDGVLGLCMLKRISSFPFQAQADEGFVTFIDAIHSAAENSGHVRSTEEFTLRLRYPGESVGRNDPSGSFLYFGNIWPCGIPTRANGTVTPKFTDNIRLWPTSGSSSSGTSYVVNATRITLYIPKHPNASHLSTDAEDWTSNSIHLVPEPAAIEPHAAGLRLLLDSCSGHSYLPPNVIQHIARQWLKMGASDQDAGHGLYCKPDNNFDECDLVFCFVGMDGSEVKYRCNAGHFLTSPWPHDSGSEGGVQSPIRAAPKGKRCILGMNFFWTAFVRHVNDPENPYIQLAPQRFIDDVGQRFEQRHIKLHKSLPPRLESIHLKRNVLDMD